MLSRAPTREVRDWICDSRQWAGYKPRAGDDLVVSRREGQRRAGEARLRLEMGKKVGVARHLSQCSPAAGLHGAGATGQYDVGLLVASSRPQ